MPTPTIAEVIRDYVTNGVPSSGAHKPRKADWRAWGTWVEQLLAALAVDAGGITELPELIYYFTVTGGTANAIVATPNATPPTAPGAALLTMTATAVNTGAATLNGKPLRANGGEELQAGEIHSGDLLAFLDLGAEYRLITDPGSLRNKLAAMEWATNPEDDPVSLESGGDGSTTFSSKHWAAKSDEQADRSEVARTGSEAARDIAAGYADDSAALANSDIYGTIDGMGSISVPLGLQTILLKGRSSTNDGLGGLFTDVDNGSTDTFASGDGRTWYRVADVSTSRRLLRDRLVDAPQIIQAKLMEVDLGGASTPIYTQATNALQGVSIIQFEGQTLLFATQRVGGSNWSATERQRIMMLTLRDDGAAEAPAEYTEPLNLGHGYDLTARVEGGEIYLYTSEVIASDKTGTNAGKGFSRVHWQGADTSQSDVQSFAVWGQVGSGHPYEKYNRAGIAVSPDGSRVWLISAAVDQGVSRKVIGYDLQAVMAATDPLEVRPTYQIDLAVVTGQSANVIQGLCDDGSNLHFAIGGTDPFGQNRVISTDFEGLMLRDVFVDLASAQYGLNGILDNATHGHPWRFEPEGITPFKNGVVLTVAEGWYGTAKIVSWQGYNWACITTADTSGVPPSNGSYWVRTTKAATDGAWSASMNYAGSGILSLDKKTIYYVGPSLGLGQEQPIQNGIADTSDPAALPSGQGGGATPVGFQWRSAFSIRAWAERVGKYFNAVEYDGGSRWKIFDQRFDSDNSVFTSLQASFTATLKYAVWRAAGTSSAAGAGIRLHASNCSDYPHHIIEISRPDGVFSRVSDQYGSNEFTPTAGYVAIAANRPDSGRTVTVKRGGVDIGGLSQNTTALKVVAASGANLRLTTTTGTTEVDRWEVDDSAGNFRPMTDGSGSVGQGSRRPSEIFSVTGTINTSDGREKDVDPSDWLVAPLNDQEIQAASVLAAEIGTYRFKAAIDTKGDGARQHVGMTVQRAIAIMEQYGLDPMRYGFICYDEWEETEDDEAGDRYGFRSDQLLLFIARGQEERLRRLEIAAEG